MNKKFFPGAGLVISLFILTIFVFAHGADNEVVMDSFFFKKFNSLNSLVRDEFLDQHLNNIIIGRGVITEILEKERYKKQYRIIVESSDAAKFGQKFIFYIFTENRDTFDLLTKDSAFEFKGQFVGYTPLDTKRNAYILDVIFMDGSTIIE